MSINNPYQSGVPSTAESYHTGKNKLYEKAEDINRAKDRQFKLLIVGAAMFIIWHQIEMYILIPKS